MDYSVLDQLVKFNLTNYTREVKTNILLNYTHS